MDLDMHYYGTYALARAAGIRADVATVIATASEYVDDSTDHRTIEHPAGAVFKVEVTSHHPSDLPANDDDQDQRRVWVPFHFIPGGEGEELTDKLICTKDSPIAREMVSHHLGNAERPWAVELIGITAHVYADTFAHYGFSGVSSRKNRVVQDSIQTVGKTAYGEELFGARLTRFFSKFGLQGGLVRNIRAVTGTIAEDFSGALGHGGVATLPDQPYLSWEYTYERPDLGKRAQTVTRRNPDDFLEGARALHQMFTAFASIRSDLADPDGGRSFDAISEKIREIIATVEEREKRILVWQKAMASGALTGKDEEIPAYNERRWRDAADDLAALPRPELALQRPLYRFYQAAAQHRLYVLRELLPAHGIVLV